MKNVKYLNALIKVMINECDAATFIRGSAQDIFGKLQTREINGHTITVDDITDALEYGSKK